MSEAYKRLAASLNQAETETPFDRIRNAQPLPERTPFQSMLKSTTAGMANAFAGQPLEDIGQAIGSKGLQGFGQNVRQKAEAVQQANPSAINSLSDAAAHPWDTVKTAVGNVLPQIPVSLASAATGARLGGMVGGLPGAAIGGLAGVFMSSYPQEYAEMRGKQRESGQENIPKALGYALPAAGLETAADVFGLGRVMPDAVKNSVIGKALGSDTLTGNRLAHVGKQAVKGIGAEAGTEYAQTGLEQIGGNQALDTEQAANERNVSALLGGIGGGVIRGGLSAFDQRNPLAGQWQPPGYEYKGEGIAGPQQRGDVIAGPNMPWEAPEAIDVSQVSRRGPGDIKPEQPLNRSPQDARNWNYPGLQPYQYDGDVMQPSVSGLLGSPDAIEAEYTVTPTGQPVPDSVKESAAQGGTLSTALLAGSQQVKTPARGLLGFNQPSDIQEAPEQPQESSFTPTHLLSDGTPVIPTDEPNIWFDGANEIEDDYAEPISATNTPRINAAIDTRAAGYNPATSGEDRGTGSPVIAGDTGATARGIGGTGDGLQGQVPSDSQSGRALSNIQFDKLGINDINDYVKDEYKPANKGNARELWKDAERLYPDNKPAQEAYHVLMQGGSVKDLNELRQWAKDNAYTPEAADAVDSVASEVFYAPETKPETKKPEIIKAKNGLKVGIYKSNTSPSTPAYKVDEAGDIFRSDGMGGWKKLSSNAKNPSHNINDVKWQLQNRADDYSFTNEQPNVQSQNQTPQETATEEAVETNAPFQIEIEADTNGGKKPDTQTILSEETMADSQIQGKSSKILPGNSEMSSQGDIGQNSEQGVSLAISGKTEEAVQRNEQAKKQDITQPKSQREKAEQVGDKPERIGDIVPKTPAIHIEGKTQTKATPAEINDALKKASERKSWSKTQMREWLVGEIDKAIDGTKESGYAATEKTDEIVKLEEEASQIRNTIQADDLTEARTGSSGIGDYAKGNLRSRLSNIDYQIQDIKAKQVADSVGMVTFDVPGDGRFKVRNTKEALRSFKEKVLASPGFKDTKRTTTSKPKAPAFSVSSMIADFLADGEHENAYYAAKEAGVRLGFGTATGDADVNVYTDIEPVDLINGRAMFVGRRLSKVETRNKTEVKAYWAVIDEKSGAAIVQANTKKEVLFKAEEAIKSQKDNGGDERLESILKQAELRGANQEQLLDKFKKLHGISDNQEQKTETPVTDKAKQPENATTSKQKQTSKTFADNEQADLIWTKTIEEAIGDTSYPLWAKTKSEREAIDKVLSSKKRDYFDAVEKAIKDGKQVPDKVLIQFPSWVRPDLNENQVDEMVDDVSGIKSPAEQLMAMKEWGKSSSKSVSIAREAKNPELEQIFKSLGKDKQAKASDINHPQAELIADVQNNWHRVLIEHGYIENKDGTFSDVGGKETEPKRILIKGKGCA